ncbi:hypothetical protein [Candidatus Allofournierella merdipullorum]|uniref:hypothetical protein n=1 Tax=Candidatus Allofournierella merdipullorum TaxID=2838595 RepID=UPI002A88C2DE|nr:hypothetical protein [Candidatus Fournierella merdipullorum]
MNREKLATVVFWVSLPLLVVCTWLALTLPMKVATGIPGERVTLGMSVSQVIEQAGPPDRTVQEDGVRLCYFHYDHRELFGHAAAVSYTFSDRQESRRAHVTEVSVSMEFETQAECDRMLETLCAHFRELMEGEPCFEESASQGPARAWDPPDLLQRRGFSSTVRIVRISQLPDRITLSVRGSL